MEAGAQVPSSFLFIIRPQAMDDAVHVHSGPSHLKLLGNIPKHAQDCVFQTILNPVKLTVMI